MYALTALCVAFKGKQMVTEVRLPEFYLVGDKLFAACYPRGTFRLVKIPMATNVSSDSVGIADSCCKVVASQT